MPRPPRLQPEVWKDIRLITHIYRNGNVAVATGLLTAFDHKYFKVALRISMDHDGIEVHEPPCDWVFTRSRLISWTQASNLVAIDEKRRQERLKSKLDGIVEEAKNLDTSQLAVSDEEARAAAPKRGKFIVIEGTHGAGTSTQSTQVVEWLQKQHDIPALRTHEPTGARIGALIRQALTKQVSFEWDALALLFAADRVDHCRTVIEPALAEGKWVVSDRGWLSSLIYQTLTSNCSPREGVHRFQQLDHVTDWVRQINLRMLKPDVAFVLAVSPEVAAARRRKRSGKSELFEEGSVADSIAEAYMMPGRWSHYLSPQQGFDTLDGELDSSTVAHAINSRVSRLVQEWKKA